MDDEGGRAPQRRKDGLKAPPQLRPGPALALGVLAAAGSIALRWILAPLLGGEERLIALFPALMLATFYGGIAGGVSCLVLAMIGAWYLFLGEPGSFVLAPHEGAGLVALLVDGGGIIAGVVAIRRLVVSLEQAREAERVLARELQHRVKNNLAVVEALAAESARGAADLPTFMERFLGRMTSLSAAQRLLSRDAALKAGVGEVVEAVLAPFQARDRIAWSGEPFDLDGPQTAALALCLHELATNALKHGALSAEAGRVRIHWSRAGRTGEISWTEQGGACAREPQRTGSGLKLLRRGLESGRPATVAFAAGGLTWSATFQVRG
ncbi:MAG TPA: sensor histidine kinase [Phenylobacterium sp.]|uniref:sensor histidine kinase n=1 Tax=Phenylobacterium sp. TaxID=1871053 RepID=UPI002C0A6605|nr:sensor histidine kinase [Phenylobacterium sp.]HSV03592.1 sensor histidine kinase [Phenylobacterium sp.]